MTPLEPSAPRFKTQHLPAGISAEIPARRNWFVMLFLCAWLGGWAMGEFSAIRALTAADDKTPSMFLAFWLLAWTLGGGFAASTVIWQLAGRELITIAAGSFSHRVEALGLGYTRTYRTSDIKDLRATGYSANPFTNQTSFLPPVFGTGFGSIAFDFGARTLRLAPALDEAEAKMLVRELQAQLPRRLDAG